MKVTIQQYLTLEAIKYNKVTAQRMVSNPNKFRYIGADYRIISKLIELGWVQEILVNPTAMTYALTAEGFKAYGALSKQKPIGRVRVYGEEN